MRKKTSLFPPVQQRKTPLSIWKHVAVLSLCANNILCHVWITALKNHQIFVSVILLMADCMKSYAFSPLDAAQEHIILVHHATSALIIVLFWCSYNVFFFKMRKLSFFLFLFWGVSPLTDRSKCKCHKSVCTYYLRTQNMFRLRLRVLKSFSFDKATTLSLEISFQVN